MCDDKNKKKEQIKYNYNACRATIHKSSHTRKTH